MLVLANANAGDMGRLHGYAQGPSSSNTIPLSTVVIVDKNKMIGNYGRLSAYDTPRRVVAGERETMPVLAGMRQIKPVKTTGGLGRLNGYGEKVEKVEDDFFNVLDTTNMAVWH